VKDKCIGCIDRCAQKNLGINECKKKCKNECNLAKKCKSECNCGHKCENECIKSPIVEAFNMFCQQMESSIGEISKEFTPSKEKESVACIASKVYYTGLELYADTCRRECKAVDKII
jgi:hypothetical protein